MQILNSFFTDLLTDSKFLIVTGEKINENWDEWELTSLATESEIIDLSELGNYICPDWVEYSNGLTAATGGSIGSNAVVCGGEDSKGPNGFRNEVLAKKIDNLLHIYKTYMLRLRVFFIEC